MHGKIAVVTGTRRGCGRGIALVLGEAGATVYVTGRSFKGNTRAPDRPETIDETAELVNKHGGTGIPVRCDHTKITDVKALYKKLKQDNGRIDILVNNAWGGYEIMVDFDPFWKIPLKHWDLMFTAGVRSHMLSSRFAFP